MELEIPIRLVIIVLGVIFVLISAAGAILTLARGTGKTKALAKDYNPLTGVTNLTKALTTLIEALTSAPIWLALAVVGVVLILLGAMMPLPL
ncbi:MAG: hypothetical protein PVG83_13575 [Acidimicrobiia bacterium]|jgi:hypothetical protein